MKPESPQEEKKPIGRPSDYSDALAETICGRLIMGESMAAICADAAMPGETTVYRWLPLHEYFRERLALAREIQADRMAAEIIEIVDDASRDVVEVDGWKEGTKREIERFTAASRDKLKIDARFKLMALLAPKKYGTKLVDVTSKGDKLQGVAIVDWDGSPVQDV